MKLVTDDQKPGREASERRTASRHDRGQRDEVRGKKTKFLCYSHLSPVASNLRAPFPKNLGPTHRNRSSALQGRVHALGRRSKDGFVHALMNEEPLLFLKMESLFFMFIFYAVIAGKTRFLRICS